ncbi:MAG: response regulator transcription factor [Polyangiaceae bacterium]|nr:response regulator transcription factor [Polyangiaceae bacterium]
MARVLFIEDDRALTAALTMAFEEEGHEVITAFDGKEGLDRISRDKPDIVICDVALPKLDGFSLCKTVRQNNPQLPFMLLTARDGDIDHALGLSLGADDYVIKPVSARVLLARLQALLRRVALLSQPSNISQIVRVGRLELDRERLECRYDGIVIETTVTEIKLIEALIAKPGVVLSRSQLLTSSRGDNSIVTDRVIDTYVRRLRRKFELVDPSFVQLETVIGAGYRWKAA